MITAIRGAAALPLGPVDHLPGYAWSESHLYLMESMRFPWGCPDSSVFLKVPPGFVVRLYFAPVEQLSSTGSLRIVGGRLWGYTQGLNSPEAMHNQRHGWNW